MSSAAVAQNPAAFSSIGGCFVSQIQNSTLPSLVLDLGTTPSFALNLFLLIPILSGLTSFLMSWLSMKNNAMPNEGSTAAMNRSMMIMMPLMSVWISFQVPAGVGIYWVLSNALALIQMYVLGKLYNPREMAAKAKAELEAQREAERQEKIEARKAAKEKQAEKNRKAAEAAKAGKKRNAPVEVEEETLIDLVENDEVDEKALSQKEINRMKLAAAVAVTPSVMARNMWKFRTRIWNKSRSVHRNGSRRRGFMSRQLYSGLYQEEEHR